MATSLAVQLMKHSKGLRPSMPSTQHLMALDSCVPSHPSVLPVYLCNIVTTQDTSMGVGTESSSRPTVGVIYTERHPRRSPHWSHSCETANCNMQSAYEHPLPVEEYLAIECTAGRVMGPLPIQTFPHAKISPLGVIPKCNQQGKWCLILNPSASEGASALLSSFVAFHMSQLMT